jgi:hypothetical protein
MICCERQDSWPLVCACRLSSVGDGPPELDARWKHMWRRRQDVVDLQNVITDYYLILNINNK